MGFVAVWFGASHIPFCSGCLLSTQFECSSSAITAAIQATESRGGKLNVRIAPGLDPGPVSVPIEKWVIAGLQSRYSRVGRWFSKAVWAVMKAATGPEVRLSI
ncbi:MAG: hypothetical protein AMXMBFR37_01720 [Steroidobacteraceae bacterium]